MTKPTLDEFIAAYGSRKYPSNMYVRQRGFKYLYVRINPRFWGKAWHDPTLDLASCEVRQPGKGVFTALIADLHRRYPSFTLYVESVFSLRFQAKLVALGFTPTGADCFILLSHPIHQSTSSTHGLVPMLQPHL